MGVLPYMNTEPLVVVFDVEYTVIFFCAPSMPASSRIPPGGAGEVPATRELGFKSYRGAPGSRVAAGEFGNVASDDDVCGRGVL